MTETIFLMQKQLQDVNDKTDAKRVEEKKNTYIHNEIHMADKAKPCHYST